MLYERQRILLSLLHALGGNIGGVDFQKLLFLFCQETKSVPGYDFVPYKFGPFSFTSYADKRKLIANSLLEPEDQAWRITRKGRILAASYDQHHGVIHEFCQRYTPFRNTQLIVMTYDKYPYYASRSTILEKLPLSRDTLNRIQSSVSLQQGLTLSTIGYEGKSIEQYINLLLQNKISILCDVRRNPISRKYGFSKTALQKRCEDFEIQYAHFPDLGIASDVRKSLHDQADYDGLFHSYVCNWPPEKVFALSSIKSWIVRGECVALTCFEQQASRCHRHCVTDELEKRYGQFFHAKHL